MDGAADVDETSYAPFQSEPNAAPVRLIVRLVKPMPGSQLALFATYSYHAFITDREGDTPDRGRYFRAMLITLISVDDSDCDFQT